MITRSLLAPFVHVWSQDDGIDRDHPSYSWDEFINTGDLAHLPVVEGGSLTVFHLAPLTRLQLQSCVQLVQQERLAEAATEATAFALKGVDNFQLGDGTMLEVKHQVQNGEKRATRATMDALHDLGLIIELGLRVIERSKLRPTRGQESR